MNIKKSDLTKLDVFDLTNTDDLPETLTNQLRRKSRITAETKNLLSLFDYSKALSVDEMLVGLYRLHGMEKSKTWIRRTITNLVACKRIGRTTAGKGSSVVFERV